MTYRKGLMTYRKGLMTYRKGIWLKLKATKRSEATRESDGSGRAEAGGACEGAGADSATRATKKAPKSGLFLCEAARPKHYLYEKEFYFRKRSQSTRRRDRQKTGN